jgi:hypothetical protein
MPKLSLRLDDLRVETFATLRWPARVGGTVLGRKAAESDDDHCDTDLCTHTCQDPPTCGLSCGSFTCGSTCGEETCDTCPDTCSPRPSCGGAFTCGGFTCDGSCPEDTCEQTKCGC